MAKSIAANSNGDKSMELAASLSKMERKSEENGLKISSYIIFDLIYFLFIILIF